MVELVGAILAYVDPLTLPSCRAVSRHWHRALTTTHVPPSQPSPAAELVPLATWAVAPPDYSRQLAAKGWLSVLRWARANGCPWN